MIGSALRVFASLIIAATMTGCATAVFNKASNAPWKPGVAADTAFGGDVMRENSIVLAFSGGGLRAAAFTHGTLTALQGMKTPEGDLLDDVAIISSVSGSSLTSAYYGLYGREGLGRFRDEVLLPADLASADEMFITSTTRELSPVVKVDDRVVGSGKPGPVTRKLLALYQQRAQELTRTLQSADTRK